MDRRHALAVLALALVAGACSSGPRALVPGSDSCRYCRMTIDDVRFGAMVITAKGRIETFDSIECLASYVAALPPGEQPRGIYVAHHDHPSQWVNATHATYLHKSRLRSPMGRELAAFPQETDRPALTERYGGTAIAWSDVLTLVQSQVPTAHTHGSAHGVVPRSARSIRARAS